MNFLLSLMLVACAAGFVYIIYDYLMGRITGDLAWSFSCIVIGIAGLIGLQLIT